MSPPSDRDLAEISLSRHHKGGWAVAAYSRTGAGRYQRHDTKGSALQAIRRLMDELR